MTCYNGLRQIFCDMTCSPRQSELVKVVDYNATTNAVTSIDFRLPWGPTQVIFDACAVSFHPYACAYGLLLKSVTI